MATFLTEEKLSGMTMLVSREPGRVPSGPVSGVDETCLKAFFVRVYTLHNDMVWADTLKVNGNPLGVVRFARKVSTVISELALFKVSVTEGRATGLKPHRLRYNVVPEVVDVRAGDTIPT